MAVDGLRHLIPERIQAGRLPRDRTIELWHGPGFGQTCDGCGLSITMAERMSLMCADEWRVIRLHAECFVLWEKEAAHRYDLAQLRAGLSHAAPRPRWRTRELPRTHTSVAPDAQNVTHRAANSAGTRRPLSSIA